jgi:hypothetical protein
MKRVTGSGGILALEFGRFGWATDPAAYRFELWRPLTP